MSLKLQSNKGTERLEQRIDDLGQYTRADDPINGLETKHCSYARATASKHQDEDAPADAPALELHTLGH